MSIIDNKKFYETKKFPDRYDKKSPYGQDITFEEVKERKDQRTVAEEEAIKKARRQQKVE